MSITFSIRSIVWLQNQRDMALERNRGPSPRRDDPHEYRIGRLKHERVKVPRGEHLLEWAMQVLKVHAARKSILEVSIFLYSLKALYNRYSYCVYFIPIMYSILNLDSNFYICSFYCTLLD